MVSVKDKAAITRLLNVLEKKIWCCVSRTGPTNAASWFI